MESCGNDSRPRPNGRPAIARRSCDQCRARKIGCDRGSPCSNCLSARVDCTHSIVTTKAVASKQRVLISAEYERKIDGIVHNVDAIRRLLEESGRRSNIHAQPVNDASTVNSTSKGTSNLLNEPQTGRHVLPPSEGPSIAIPLWDHSAHVIDFVKDIIERAANSDNDLIIAGHDSTQVLTSLRNLISALDSPEIAHSLQPIGPTAEKLQRETSMPPLESVVEILRWSKSASPTHSFYHKLIFEMAEHADYSRITWICKIFPLEKFEEICCKVYFAVSDYTEIEFIIANGFLSYVFAEHMAIHGVENSREFSYMCRSNLDVSLPRLPLLLPASAEVIAALTLAALHSIEDSKASRAWTLISSALSLCQTLGYHRLRLARRPGEIIQNYTETLFWFVYSLEGGLSLRLGRSSGIQDTDITLPIDPTEPRTTKVARIQRKVYNQLYSPGSLSSSAERRGKIAQELTKEIKAVIEESRFDISNIASKLEDSEENPMRMVYLHCGWVCQSSLLVLILRAIPVTEDSEIFEKCLAAARETFDIHQQCMSIVRACRDPLLVTKYITWALLHTPFVPFSILFTHSVYRSDIADLGRLDDFAASLKHQVDDKESPKHTYQLYDLLCQAARLHIEPKMSKLPGDAIPFINHAEFSDDTVQANVITDMETEMDMLQANDYSPIDLGDWYYSNQQLMSLLDEDVMF